MKRILTIISFSLPLLLQAEELEYKMDIGGGVGLSHYWGDANTGTSAMGAVTCRYIFNPHMAVRMGIEAGGVTGNTEGIYIPADAGTSGREGGARLQDFSFSRAVMDIGAQFEINFLAYGMGAGYKKLSRITPYALIGFGLTVGMGGGAPAKGGINFPVGLGVKYKVKPRLNLGLEWAMHFSTTDGLDITREQRQLSDPYGVNSGFLKNKDSYSFLMFFITYDICPKYRKCNN